MFSNDLSESEKIDAIHAMLLSQRRASRFMALVKILILAGLFYGYHYITQPENAEIKQRVTQLAEKKLAEFVAPIAQSVVQNVMSNMQLPTPQRNGEATSGNGNASAPITVTPEMIRAVRESMGNNN